MDFGCKTCLLTAEACYSLLSGILHICDGNFGLSNTDTAALHNAVVDLFYSEELSEADLNRARNAEDLWSTWVRVSLRGGACSECLLL
jgi:hypothetical protein